MIFLNGWNFLKTQKANRPKIKYRLDVRTQLLKIGKKQLLRDGAKGLSVRKVADEAKINLGSFVYHFKNKEKFLETIILDHYSDFLITFNIEFEKMSSLALAKDQLSFILNRMANLADAHAEVVARFFIDTLQGDSTLVKAFSKNPPAHAQRIIEIIHQGQTSGEFRTDISPNLAFLLCMFVVMVPQVLLTQFKSKIKFPVVRPLVSEFLGKPFLQIRIDLIMKGLKR